jgi:hypothetical protein
VLRLVWDCNLYPFADSLARLGVFDDVNRRIGGGSECVVGFSPRQTLQHPSAKAISRAGINLMELIPD